MSNRRPDPAADDAVERTATIVNKRGLHARAAARFVKLAAQFDAAVTVMHKDISVSGRSIMGLMMLAAAPGSEIRLSAKGQDAASAVDALAALIAAKFEED